MRKIGSLLVCLLSCVAVWAQTLEIKKEFTKEPYASVLSKYANEFREHEMPDMPTGQQFPYAVVCVNLQGNGGDVAAAKRFLSLDLGAFPVQERVTDLENMVLFLVPSSVARVSLTCGDGCSKVRILDLPQLESNAVYSGTVHFTPVEGTQVVEVVDKEQLKQELFSEFASLWKTQQSAQSEESQATESAEQPDASQEKQNRYEQYSQNATIKTLLSAQIGYSVSPQWSYGVLFGQMYSGYGWYVSGRSDFRFGTSAVATCDADGLVEGVKPFYSGNTQSSHLAIHGGFMMNVLESVTKNKFHTLGFYVGGGYGKRELLAETTKGEWIKYAPTSHAGFAGNVGLFGSVAGVTLHAGVSTINFKYMDLEVGIGFMF